MDPIKNILVVVDPLATAHPAVDKAVRLAEHCNARIELFACETQESKGARYAAHLASGSSNDFIVNLQVIFEPLAQQIRARGMDVSIDTATGDPLHTMLLDRIVRSSADLVVKDTHHHSLMRRAFITNTDWHLIRGCKAPLLLTRQRPWSSCPVIGAALDPGHVNDKPELLDRRILEIARALAAKLGGSLHAVHAYLPLIMAAQAAGGSLAMTVLLTSTMIEDLRVEKLRIIEPLAREFGVSSADLHLQMGVASDVLPRVAEEASVDIMALGAISRGVVQRMIVGSTAERVLERMPCDILVVKPPDFADCLPF